MCANLEVVHVHVLVSCVIPEVHRVGGHSSADDCSQLYIYIDNTEQLCGA